MGLSTCPICKTRRLGIHLCPLIANFATPPAPSTLLGYQEKRTKIELLGHHNHERSIGILPAQTELREEIHKVVKQLQLDLRARKGVRAPIAVSPLGRPISLFPASAHGRRSLRFIAGTALIAVSFLVYLAYPVILLYLPFSAKFKVGGTVGVWILSWVVFSAGVILTGPEGYAWLRGLWTRMSGGNGREGAG